MIIQSEPIDVGRGFSVEMEFDTDLNHFQFKWSPDVPRGRNHKAILPAYIEARNRFVNRVAREIGANVAIIDMG